jgi:hypothetical protein
VPNSTGGVVLDVDDELAVARSLGTRLCQRREQPPAILGERCGLHETGFPIDEPLAQRRRLGLETAH